MSTSDLYRQQRKQYSNIRCESLTCDGSLAGKRSYAVIQYNEAVNTDSINITTAPNFVTVPLNEIISDPDSIINSLAVNRFSLEVGTYKLTCNHNLYNSAVTRNLTRTILRNVTSGEIILSSVNNSVRQGDEIASCLFTGTFDVTDVLDLYEIQTYFSVNTNTGFGLKLNVGGDKELHLNLFLEKII